MDQSMICLPSDVKTALEKTSFIKRYEMLSNTFNGERTPLNDMYPEFWTHKKLN